MFEIGTSLREARLRQHVEIPEAEQGTKIRGKYLRALEEEQFEVLPAQTYVKGFLRAYAEYLGLDGQLYVDEYNSRYIGGEDETPLRARRSPRPRPQRGVESNVVLFTLVAIAAAAALVIAAWKFGGSEPERTPVGALPVGSGRPTPVRAHRTVPKVAKLALTASAGSCWLQIRVGSPRGRLLYADVLEQGETLRRKGKRLWINVGIPENLTVKLNGKRTSFPGGGPQVVVVTPKGITRAAA